MCTPLAGQRVQISRQRRNQRFSFAGFHFRDFALMQHDAADQLHVKMPHPKRPPPRFAHHRKRRNQRRLQRFLQLLLDLRVVVLNALNRACTSAFSFGVYAASSASVSFCIAGSSALISATTG